jgi:transcription initiation factor IIE alpha subunit
MDDDQETQTEDRSLHCPACAYGLQLTHQFLDPEKGKTIRLFKCERCGERIWDE